MSIRQIQVGRILEEATRSLYSSGKKPTLGSILNIVSRHFSKYPAGRPLPIPQDVARYRQVSNVKRFNEALVHMADNVDVAYEAMLEHVDDVLILTNSLQSHLERLKTKRRRVETQIDDYLLSLYNTDGYFYSISDTFADLALTDVVLSSAHIDVSAGFASIPSAGSFTRQVPKDLIGTPSVGVTVNGATAAFNTLSSFAGAVEDDLDNTAWIVEVDTLAPANVVLTASFRLGATGAGVSTSRIELTPYGVTPVQMFIETRPGANEENVSQDAWEAFGNRIVFSTEKTVFITSLRSISMARLTLRKNEPDYTTSVNGITKYRYIFGARTLALFEQVYDTHAQFVSAPLAFAEGLESEMVVDAVTLTVDDETPINTSITYYLAGDPGDPVASVDDLEWRRVLPLSREGDSGSIIRFDGAQPVQRMIRAGAAAPDIQLIPFNTTSGDPLVRNPSGVIVPGEDIYRICAFEETPLAGTLKLEEGINTLKITYLTTLQLDAVKSVGYWMDLDEGTDVRTAYGRIDAGNDFFYGGDIGESDVSAFVETFIESDIDRPTFLAECSKPDLSSQQWDMRVILNGNEIGWMPVGTNRLQLPWTMRQGLNHLILLVNIPSGHSTGTINLMGDNNLFDFGTVKLATWNHVDFFDLQYNSAGNPLTFSTFNGELISRREPTDNFRLSFSRDTGIGPGAVRFRADFARADNNPYVSPRLNSYRLRFNYGVE